MDLECSTDLESNMGVEALHVATCLWGEHNLVTHSG